MLSTHFSPLSFFPMENKIQHYAWGSISSIHDLFGFENTSHRPQAEVWMGTHPKGCSMVKYDQDLMLLSDLIQADKSAYLSPKIAQEFGDLPFLFKILAADKALSIQVHPNKAQAEAGFESENKAGILLDADHRNYKDANHKPELVYALTDYQAMNGFRPYEEIIDLFEPLGIIELSEFVTDFKNTLNAEGLRAFFNGLLTLSEQRKNNALDQLLTYAHINQDQALFALIITLSTQYPNDIGLFSPLILNVITLKSGEAMYLSANTPHAYIHGTGLEVMANSDNVLRAGLTPKHIDVTELTQCTQFIPTPFESLLLKPNKEGKMDNYHIPVNDFNFTIIHHPLEEKIEPQSAEIIMPIDSDVTLHSNNETLLLAKGKSVFIPAYIGCYTLSSTGRIARAFS